MTPDTHHCPHCEATHTLPPRTTEPLTETVKHNHARRVARLRIGGLWNEVKTKESYNANQFI